MREKNTTFKIAVTCNASDIKEQTTSFRNTKATAQQQVKKKRLKSVQGEDAQMLKRRKNVCHETEEKRITGNSEEKLPSRP